MPPSILHLEIVDVQRLGRENATTSLLSSTLLSVMMVSVCFATTEVAVIGQQADIAGRSIKTHHIEGSKKNGILSDVHRFKKARLLLESLGNDYGIEIVWDRKIALSWNPPYRLVQAREKKAFEKYAKLLDEEFRKYPKTFIEASKLKKIFIATDFKIAKQIRQAIPDYVKEILILDFRAGTETYLRHILHHEFYHMLEEEFNGSAYFNDPAWAKLNKKGTAYGRGGAFARGKDQGKLIHPKIGFVNLYSTSGLEEDKAEIYAILFAKKSWNTVKKWLPNDPILENKVNFMKHFLKRQDKAFDADYWKTLHESVKETRKKTKPGKSEDKKSQQEENFAAGQKI